MRWNQMSYDKRLIPGSHILCLLYARYVHERAHLGVDSDVTKVRSEFWIVVFAKSIVVLEKSVYVRKYIWI